MGVPVGTERVLTTRPYYRSSYVFVYGPNTHAYARSTRRSSGRCASAGEVDLAIAWGPIAGYYARHGHPALAIRAVPERDAPPGQRFQFELAMAVRKDDAPLRDRLDDVLTSLARPIAALLDSYGVPRL